jgi:ketosteroid isomerase-like protein
METLVKKDEELRQKNYELVQRFMHNSDKQVWFDMLHEQTVLEFPYASSLGSPERLEGKAAVVNYLSQMLAQIGNLQFKGVVTTKTGDPGLFFNEYYADIITPGGKPYRQTYINKMQVKDGKIIFNKEFWDTKKIIDAVDFKIKN